MTTTAFSYTRLKRRRDKLFLNVLRRHVNVALTGPIINIVCEELLANLPNSTSRAAVFESIRVLAGSTLSEKEAKIIAWRLAGNTDKLIAGFPVLPWTHQTEDEIVPICVENVKLATKRNLPGVLLSCRALSGSPCPMLFSEFVSLNSCAAISRALGFSAPFGPYPYSAPAQFVNLLFNAHIEASRSRTTPSFITVTASSSMVRHNREKIEVRCRAKPCPRGFEHACTQCWVGYDQCEFAVHPKTYVTRYCPACNAMGLFSPDECAMECQVCRRKVRTAGKE
ncbi:hypothetical protein EBZ39_03485 [bacterium]|nr:hypothetical protein [bacterium]